MVVDISRVERRFGFNQEDVNFLVRNRQMFHALWDDCELTLPDSNFTVAKLDQQFSLYYQEEFIFSFMVVPDEFPFELGQLHI
jgi:hypothetical protein